MLFLLPPSESKRVGGGALTIEQVALTFGGLNPTREKVLAALLKLSRKPRVAQRVLKLGPKQLDQIAVNLAIPTAPTMPALDRYTGTLYDAIDAPTLSATARARAKESVLIQTALFGLISSSDRIPDYRLSAGTSLPGLNLKAVWPSAHEPIFRRLNQGLVVDLRSKAYVELAPIPKDIPSVWIEVMQAGAGGQLRALNHFNKQSKGLLIRALLDSPKRVETWNELAVVAAKLGFELHEPDVSGVAHLVIG